MQDESPEEREHPMTGPTQTALAAREAASIGGSPSTGEPPGDECDEAMRPVAEAGGGEAEGFEQSEQLLIEHASHGDQRPAHAVLHDATTGEEALPGRADGEADSERTSEREDEETPSEQ
jgi:hypothetical protein